MQIRLPEAITSSFTMTSRTDITDSHSYELSQSLCCSESLINNWNIFAPDARVLDEPDHDLQLTVSEALATL